MLFAGVADGVEHALDAALAEAAGDEDAVEAFQLRLVAAVVGAFGLEAFGFDPGDFQFEVLRDGAVGERFLERLVAVFVLDIFADDGDGDFVFGVVAAVDEIAPWGEVRLGRVVVQVLEDERVDALFGKAERDFVDEGHGLGADDGLLFDVAEGGDLLLDSNWRCFLKFCRLLVSGIADESCDCENYDYSRCFHFRFPFCVQERMCAMLCTSCILFSAYLLFA